MKYRKKPVTVNAWQIQKLDTDHTIILPVWVMRGIADGILSDTVDGGLNIKTLEGVMHGKPGDWLVQGHIKKELWVVDREIFEATYEPVPDVVYGALDIKTL